MRHDNEDKETRAYYDSIQVTPAELAKSKEIAARHHKHNFRTKKGKSGVVFYECECGVHYASAPKGGLI